MKDSKKGNCEVCGAEIEIRPFVVFRRMTCSQKCRQIKWALKEANKVMKKSLIVIFLLLFGAQNLVAQTGTASYYGVEACQFNPDPKCPMANGESLYEAIKKGTPYAAMWGVDFGKRVRVTNSKTGKNVLVIVQDRGPARRLARAIDLNPKIFAEICDIKKGLCQVNVEVMQ